MDYLEIELDGVICAKRCPKCRTAQGMADTSAILAARRRLQQYPPLLAHRALTLASQGCHHHPSA
jgi:hypothetical protein